jgi:hypothetical protein
VSCHQFRCRCLYALWRHSRFTRKPSESISCLLFFQFTNNFSIPGNDAAIICDDVDIDTCLPKIATLSFLNSGQICVLTKRIYIHENIYDEFRDKMVEFTKNNIKTGAGTEEGVTVGPIQNKMQ